MGCVHGMLSIKWALFTYPDHFFKSVQVLFHTVVRAQKGDEVAGVHSIEAMEESINTGVEVDKIDFCHVAYNRKSQIGLSWT